MDLHEETNLVRVRLVHVFQGTRLVLDVQGHPRLEHSVLDTPDTRVDDQVHEQCQVLAGRVHPDPKNREVVTGTHAVPGARGVLGGHPDPDKKDTEPRCGQAGHRYRLHLGLRAPEGSIPVGTDRAVHGPEEVPPGSAPSFDE